MFCLNKEYLLNFSVFKKIYFFKSPKLKKFKNLKYFNNFNFKIYLDYNKINKLYYFNLNSFINELFNNNYNFILIGNGNINTLPLYLYIFNYKNVFNNKIYFFPKKSNIIYQNYLFFYKSFLKKFKINFVFFLNYLEYINYFKYFLKFNLPMGSLIFKKEQNIYLDFYFIIQKKNFNFLIFSFYNLILLKYFYFNKLNLYNFKIKFLSSFIK